MGYASIARGGSAVYTLNGGTLNVYTYLNVGDLAGSSGTLNINGGQANINGSFYVGKNGPAAQGVVNQTGGAVYQPAGNGNELYLGSTSGGTGTYNISAGSLNTGDIRTDSGTGFFNQTGGAVTIGTQANKTWLRLGINSGASAVYSISGTASTLTDYGEFNVGESGSGTVSQADGYIAVLNDGVSLATNVSGAGSYTMDGGTLAISGGPLDVGLNGTGSFTQNSGTVVIANSNNLYVGFAASAVGTYLFTGGTISTQDIRVGEGASGQIGGSGTMTQTAGVANLNGWLRLAEYEGTSGLYNFSGGTINAAGHADVGEEGSGTLNVSGNALLIVGSNFRIGQPNDNTAIPGSGLVNLTNPPTGSVATINVVGRTNLGGGGGTGVLNIAGNVMFSVTGSGTTDAVGIGDSTVGAGIYTTYGTLTMNGGTLNAYNQFWVSNGSLGNGVFNLGGGVVNVNNWIAVGRNGGSGTFTMTGGTINKTGGGNIIVDSLGGPGVWYMDAGLVTNNSQLILGETTNTGTLYLNGGTVQATAVGNNGGSSTGNLYFNGGVLQASASGTAWFSNSADNAYVQTGGAIIDSHGFNITIGDSLSPDPAISGVDGGLTKLGLGTLTLTGTNTYQGGTIVENGTLILANDEAIADGTSLIVGDPSLFSADVVPSSVADLATGLQTEVDNASTAPSPVPEPGTLGLFAAGIVGTVLAAGRRIRSGRTTRKR